MAMSGLLRNSGPLTGGGGDLRSYPCQESLPLEWNAGHPGPGGDSLSQHGQRAHFHGPAQAFLHLEISTGRCGCVNSRPATLDHRRLDAAGLEIPDLMTGAPDRRSAGTAAPSTRERPMSFFPRDADPIRADFPALRHHAPGQRPGAGPAGRILIAFFIAVSRGLGRLPCLGGSRLEAVAQGRTRRGTFSGRPVLGFLRGTLDRPALLRPAKGPRDPDGRAAGPIRRPPSPGPGHLAGGACGTGRDVLRGVPRRPLGAARDFRRNAVGPGPSRDLLRLARSLGRTPSRMGSEPARRDHRADQERLPAARLRILRRVNRRCPSHAGPERAVHTLPFQSPSAMMSPSGSNRGSTGTGEPSVVSGLDFHAQPPALDLAGKSGKRRPTPLGSQPRWCWCRTRSPRSGGDGSSQGSGRVRTSPTRGTSSFSSRSRSSQGSIGPKTKPYLTERTARGMATAWKNSVGPKDGTPIDRGGLAPGPRRRLEARAISRRPVHARAPPPNIRRRGPPARHGRPRRKRRRHVSRNSRHTRGERRGEVPARCGR